MVSDWPCGNSTEVGLEDKCHQSGSPGSDLEGVLKSSPLSGTWVSLDEISSVELTIRKKRSGYCVIAKDSYDGEIAAVSEVQYQKSPGVLSFATYWTSSGRFTRYRMSLHVPGKVEITYTHTDSEILVRKTRNRAGGSR
jgi:hypothetical protein